MQLSSNLARIGRGARGSSKLGVVVVDSGGWKSESDRCRCRRLLYNVSQRSMTVKLYKTATHTKT